MSRPSARSNETARRRPSGLVEDNDGGKETVDAMSPNSKDYTSQKDTSPTTSRYGRAIKPKTPTNGEVDSPKVC